MTPRKYKSTTAKQPAPKNSLSANISPEALELHDLNYLLLHDKELKLLTRLTNALGDISIAWLIGFSAEELMDVPGLGQASLSALPGLQERILNSLREYQDAPDSDCPPNERRLCVSKLKRTWDWTQIQRILIEDFEAMLFREPPDMQTIMLGRWGYTVPEQRLQVLGTQFNLTRERIRQKEKKFNSMIPKCLRIHPSALRAQLELHLQEDFAELMPQLAELFTHHRLFYEFLERCSGMEAGTIERTQHLDNKTRLRRTLEDFFCATPSPVSVELLLEVIESECELSPPQAQQAVDRLIKQGRLEETSTGLVPRLMTKKTAVAHVLLGHSRGLPWKDASTLININRFSSSTFPEERLDSSFVSCEDAYLCARGTYRHIQYLQFKPSNIASLLLAIQETVSKLDCDSISLLELHQELGEHFVCSYYELRHILSTYGEAHGIFFDGTSSNDTVSLRQYAGRAGNRSVILHQLKRAPGGLTVAELAASLRTKSIKLASLLLEQLLQDGLAIRVDRMMYASLDAIASTVDIPRIGEKLDEIIMQSDLPIEIGALRDAVNTALRVSHSKYLYLSLGKRLQAQYGWFRQRTLFSSLPIRCNGLLDLARSLFSPEFPDELLRTRLAQNVRITHTTATLALGWVRAGRESEGALDD